MEKHCETCRCEPPFKPGDILEHANFITRFVLGDTGFIALGEDGRYYEYGKDGFTLEDFNRFARYYRKV